MTHEPIPESGYVKRQVKLNGIFETVYDENGKPVGDRLVKTEKHLPSKESRPKP